MLPPDYLEHVADDVLELYSELDQTIVRDIVRRLVKTGEVTSTARWQLAIAQESGLLYDQIIAEVARCSNASEQQVRTVFEDAGVKAVYFDAEIYKAAGLSPPPLAISPAALQVLNAGVIKTNGYLRNLTMTTANQAQQAYISAATLAEMQVESGAFDYATAIRNAVRSAAKEGAWVQYPTGHRDRLDVAIRRAVLTGVGQTAAQISIAYADDMGCDLVETTAHAGARPSHMEWQGRVFSRSGRSPKYPDFESSTGYGTGSGLCGYNCRHSFFPFFEGLSALAYPRERLQEYENQTVIYEGEKFLFYDATQMQRSMERNIRSIKRELAAYDEAIKSGASMQGEFEAAAVKLKRQEAKLYAFLRQTELGKDSARLQVAGFGRSQAQKAVWANKRVLSYGELKGISTPNGITVSGATIHFGERAVSRGVSIPDIQDALTSPLRIGKIKIDSAGRKSVELTGKNARVQINPADGSLITVWKTSDKLRRRLQGENK